MHLNGWTLVKFYSLTFVLPEFLYEEMRINMLKTEDAKNKKL